MTEGTVNSGWGGIRQWQQVPSVVNGLVSGSDSRYCQ